MKEYRIRREYAKEGQNDGGWKNHPLLVTTDERTAKFKWEEVRAAHMISGGRAANQDVQVARLVFESREVSAWLLEDEEVFDASAE